MNTRPAAVAGAFYPHEPKVLQQMIDDLLIQVVDSDDVVRPRAIIVPHAGYIYSGLTAAYAYQTLKQYKHDIQRVILLGPSHYVAFQGMAVPSVDSFSTPLGNINLDTQEISYLVKQSLVIASDQAHQQEHSLEVQLPFLQRVLDDFELLPIVVGQSPTSQTSAIIEKYINNPDDLVVISTDLSHFLTYEQAQQRDNQTAKHIQNKEIAPLTPHDACGVMPLTGMMQTCISQNLDINLLDLRNSGDTAGDKQRVVGYGSWIVA